MISFFRIDERLIHGQIAIKWSRHTGVDHIVVCNDAAANSSIIQKSLKMAVDFAPAEWGTLSKKHQKARAQCLQGNKTNFSNPPLCLQ